MYVQFSIVSFQKTCLRVESIHTLNGLNLNNTVLTQLCNFFTELKKEQEGYLNFTKT